MFPLASQTSRSSHILVVRREERRIQNVVKDRAVQTSVSLFPYFPFHCWDFLKMSPAIKSQQNGMGIRDKRGIRIRDRPLKTLTFHTQWFLLLPVWNGVKGQIPGFGWTEFLEVNRRNRCSSLETYGLPNQSTIPLSGCWWCNRGIVQWSLCPTPSCPLLSSLSRCGLWLHFPSPFTATATVKRRTGKVGT